MGSFDYYALLGVTSYASAREIDQAYRMLATRLGSGPDVSPALLDLLREAHQTLIDPRQRAAYDHGRTVSADAPAPQPTQPGSTPVHDEAVLQYLRRWRRARRIFALCVLLLLLLGLILWWGSTFPT